MSRFAPAAAAALITAAAGLAPLAAASAAPYEPGARSCFFVTQWRGWKSPSPRVLYLGVNNHDVYQVDLAADAPELKWGDARLISQVRDTTSICSAIDLDLKVSDGHGFSSPLFPRSMRKLTPEEVAAIPPKDRP